MSNYPEIRFKGFTDAWEQRELGEVANITMGQSPSSINYTTNKSDNILVQGNADIKNGKVFPRIWTTQITKVAQKNDILLCVRAPVGDVARTDYDVVIGRGVAGIKGNEFIYYSLIKLKESGYWRKLSSGSTFESINSNDIKEAQIHIPKFDEQKKVGTLISNIDKTITLHQRKLDHLVEIKKGFLQKIFPENDEIIPKVRFNGFTDAWEQRELKEIGNTFTGLSGKSKNDFGHGNASYITYMNVFSNAISNIQQTEKIEIDEKQNSVLYGDVLFTTSSETPEDVGMSSVWLGNDRNVYLNSFCFGYRPLVKFNPYFLGNLLRANTVRKDIKILAQGVSRYNISKTKLLEITIPFPSSEEQILIGNLLKQLDQTITLHQRELDKLKEIKQGFLQKLFL